MNTETVTESADVVEYDEVEETGETVTNEHGEVYLDENGKPITIDSRRVLFGPDRLDHAQLYISALSAHAEQHELEVLSNFELADGVNEGWGLVIAPVQERLPDPEDPSRNKLIAVGFVIAQVPWVDVVLAHAAGKDLIENALVAMLIPKVINAVKPALVGEVAVTDLQSMPRSLDDFLVRAKKGETYAVFNQLADKFVEVLKERGIKELTKTMLKKVLSNTGAAKTYYPNIDQRNWVITLETMISQAEKLGLDPSLFHRWIETRDEATIAESSLEIDGIDDLLAAFGDDDEVTEDGSA